MSVQSVNEGLDGGFIDVPDVGGGLARFLAEDDGVWVDETEGVNDDFPFYGLDGVDDNGYCAGVEGFEGLGGPLVLAGDWDGYM